MLVLDLNGIEYEWKIPNKIAQGNKRKTSKLHQIAREVLKNAYNNTIFYEEVPFIVENKQKLFFDFYNPSLLLAIEVHGEQHYSFCSLYHKNKIDFMKQQVNDKKKRQWCSLNNIQLIELPYNTVNHWEKAFK